MASTDAKAVPIKGQAYRVTFPVFASDGALSLGQTLLSQISIDAASAIYGARPVEISANMGLYYLDLTAAEMNGQTIAIVATPSGGGSGASVAVRSVPIVLYTQGPTSAFYAQVMSVDATPLDGIASTVWASSSRSLSTFGNIVNAVWATPTRALRDWTGIVNAVWATPSRTLTSLGSDTITADTLADSATGEMAAIIWATASRTLSSFGTLQGDVVNAVWATPTRPRSRPRPWMPPHSPKMPPRKWPTRCSTGTLRGVGPVAPASCVMRFACSATGWMPPLGLCTRKTTPRRRGRSPQRLMRWRPGSLAWTQHDEDMARSLRPLAGSVRRLDAARLSPPPSSQLAPSCHGPAPRRLGRGDIPRHKRRAQAPPGLRSYAARASP